MRIYGVDANNNVVSHLTQRIYEGSYIVPTNNFVSRYLMADGLPITKSPLYKTPDATMTHADFFKKRDPRMSFTLLKEVMNLLRHLIIQPQTQHIKEVVMALENMLIEMIGHINDHSLIVQYCAMQKYY